MLHCYPHPFSIPNGVIQALLSQANIFDFSCSLLAKVTEDSVFHSPVVAERQAEVQMSGVAREGQRKIFELWLSQIIRKSISVMDKKKNLRRKIFLNFTIQEKG